MKHRIIHRQFSQLYTRTFSRPKINTQHSASLHPGASHRGWGGGLGERRWQYPKSFHAIGPTERDEHRLGSCADLTPLKYTDLESFDLLQLKSGVEICGETLYFTTLTLRRVQEFQFLFVVVS